MMNPTMAGASTCMSSAPPPRNAAIPPHSSMALRPGTGSAAHRRRSQAFISARDASEKHGNAQQEGDGNQHPENDRTTPAVNLAVPNPDLACIYRQPGEGKNNGR